MVGDRVGGVRYERQLSDTVVLREARVADAASLAAAYDRNRDHLAPWDPARPPSFFTEHGQRSLLTQRLATSAAGEGQAFLLVEGDDVVGGISLNQIVRGPAQRATVGYWIDHAHVGRGLATAAVGAVVDFATETLRLHRLEAGALPRNTASRAVLTRSGFVEYGYAASYLRIAGEWEDHVLYHRLLGPA
jgi:ribosomal-protein-alanine N-acetyltransferase